jgi:molybdenum cofactor cytidylyltransferase
MNIGIILLAAGSSTRMGQSKQLLTIGHESLLQHAVNAAIESNAHPVIVVLGANSYDHSKILGSIEDNAAYEIVVNQRWQTGMGSSLKAGLQYLISKYPQTDGALIMVCDQPKVNARHLQTLMSNFEDAKKVVASYYDLTPGVPAIFGRRYFDEIFELDDQEGAKKIIHKNLSSTTLIDFPEGSVDLDTPDDYARFKQGGQ